MTELMSHDRAKHNVLPLTKFGLMQITRQRIRPVTEINVLEKCPLCHGTGKITSTVVIDEQVERRLAYYVQEKHLHNLTLRTSPILGAYLSRGAFGSSYVAKWRRKYHCKLKLVESTANSILQYEFLNEKEEVLD